MNANEQANEGQDSWVDLPSSLKRLIDATRKADEAYIDLPSRLLFKQAIEADRRN